jgi:Na+/H+-dicarboxylate symporter
MKKMQLTTKIFIGLILGAIVGAMLYPVREVPFVSTYVIGFGFHLVGKIFMNSIKMMVVPLVFFSLIMGTTSITDIKKLGRIGTKTLGFYLGTTAVAITIALGLANIVNPGKGLDLGTIETASFAVKESKTFVNVLIDMVPTNPVAAMASGNMLQIIVFSILCGVALTMLGKKSEKLIAICSDINDMVLKIVEIIMLFAPIGVFGLIGKTFATLGYGAMKPLLVYMLTVLGALFIHALFTYQGLLFIFARYNPITFFKKFAPAISVAFSTSSSGATIPVTMDTLLTRFKVPKDITSFTIPLGATVNMDGTAIMQGVATVFIAQVYGINLGPADYLAVILTATLASVGTAGVPGVGLIMLSMVLTQVGVPVEGIGLIMGVDRILDMTRTAVNITGDAVCTLIVAKTEGELIDSSELEAMETLEA